MNGTTRFHSPLIVRASVLFAILLLPLMLALSADYGATWDEPLQQQRGEKIAAYYLGRVADLTFPEDGAHLYGAPFDVLAVAIQSVVPGDPYVVRHALNAFVGWLGVVCCGLLAYRMFGSSAALLSMMLLVGMPRYFGHSMNNPKDIPFATLSTGILYLLCRLPERYPFFSWRSATALALLLGMALNVRPGALLFLAYAATLIAFRLLEQKPGSLRPALVTSVWLGAITLITLCIGSVFWPWALQRPVIGPILGLAQVSRFGWVGTVLFDGRDVDAFAPMWDYVPVWLLITTPMVTLMGLALAIPLLRGKSGHQGAVLALWATVAFPVVYVIGVRALLYDEVRHLLFIQPPIAVLAAAGWVTALQVTHGAMRRVVALLLAAAMVRPILFEVREHPNQVVYFNELVGGPAGAYGRYEMDYWGNCLLQALERTEVATGAETRRVRVAGWPGQIVGADATRYPHLDVTDRDAGTHQIDIVLARGSGAFLANLAARHDLVARVVTHDGALLCAVLPGPSFGTLDLSRTPRQATTFP